jgi:hypothetical protein
MPHIQYPDTLSSTSTIHKENLKQPPSLHLTTTSTSSEYPAKAEQTLTFTNAQSTLSLVLGILPLCEQLQTRVSRSSYVQNWLTIFRRSYEAKTAEEAGNLRTERFAGTETLSWRIHDFLSLLYFFVTVFKLDIVRQGRFLQKYRLLLRLVDRISRRCEAFV